MNNGIEASIVEWHFTELKCHFFEIKWHFTIVKCHSSSAMIHADFLKNIDLCG